MDSVEYEKFILPNGLEVIISEDRSHPITAVNVWYHVGSKDEVVGRTGFAHLFEHVMFEGSKNHNKLFFEPLQKVGGSVNGSTTSDRTNYWENVPPEHLELALWLESDRMGFLLDALDQKRFDVQRDVVKNERRQSYENRPYGSAQLMMQPLLFPPPHPYSWPVIGSQEDLDLASLEDIKSFFRQYYCPSNASLAIAGDFDGSKVKSLVERYFGDIPPGQSINRIGRMESGLQGEVRVEMKDKIQLSRLTIAWPTVPTFDRDEAALDILACMLGDGKSSRLYKILVYDKQIAREVVIGNYSQEIAGEFHIQITAGNGGNLDEIDHVLSEQLDYMRVSPPSDNELRRAINRVEAQHIRQMEHIGGFGGRADQLNYYNIFGKNPELINTDIERYRTVSVDEIMRVAEKYLGSNRVHLEITPEASNTQTVHTLDRTVMPGSSTTKAYIPPVPIRDRLPNGLKLLHVHKPGLPVVAIAVLLDKGACSDPKDHPGLANLTATMVAEGTHNLSGQQISEDMEFLGSKLLTNVGREYSMVFAETITKHWPRSMEIISDVIINPSFPEKEFERIRAEHLADLRRTSADPVAVSQMAIRAILYGHGSPYGHPIGGTESSTKKISREEIVDYFKTNFGPQNATLIAVGDITTEELIDKATECFGDWDNLSKTQLFQGKVLLPTQPETTIYIIDRPGAPQSVIQAGQATIARLDPNYFSLVLINQIFGGDPTARLFKNLRQDKGFSYGYYSQIDWMNGPSALIAGGSVQTGVTKESIVETLKEFTDISTNKPISAQELGEATDGMSRGFPSQFQTRNQLLQALSQLSIFNLPDDYYSDVINNINSKTLGQIRSVASNLIDHEHLSVLVVGDHKVIEPGIKELGFPLAVINDEGVSV